MTDPNERICVFCKHFNIRMAESGYSEYTPGSDMSMGCLKGIWEHDNYDDGTDTYRKNILRAETCKEFIDRDPRRA